MSFAAGRATISFTWIFIIFEENKLARKHCPSRSWQNVWIPRWYFRDPQSSIFRARCSQSIPSSRPMLCHLHLRLLGEAQKRLKMSLLYASAQPLKFHRLEQRYAFVQRVPFNSRPTRSPHHPRQNYTEGSQYCCYDTKNDLDYIILRQLVDGMSVFRMHWSQWIVSPVKLIVPAQRQRVLLAEKPHGFSTGPTIGWHSRNFCLWEPWMLQFVAYVMFPELTYSVESPWNESTSSTIYVFQELSRCLPGTRPVWCGRTIVISLLHTRRWNQSRSSNTIFQRFLLRLVISSDVCFCQTKPFQVIKTVVEIKT